MGSQVCAVLKSILQLHVQFTSQNICSFIYLFIQLKHLKLAGPQWSIPGTLHTVSATLLRRDCSLCSESSV